MVPSSVCPDGPRRDRFATQRYFFAWRGRALAEVLQLDHRVRHRCAPYAACDSDRSSTRMADLGGDVVAVPFRQPDSTCTMSLSANIRRAALHE